MKLRPSLSSPIFSRRPRWVWMVTVVAVLAVGLWQASAWKGRQNAPARGGSFTEALIGQPQVLNPLVSLDATDRAVLRLIFPGLTYTDARGNTEAVLAESWEVSSEGKTYTFVLKPDLKWHDGETLTTSDIAETIQRVTDPQQKSPYLKDWEAVTVEVVDARQIKFHLPQANASFIAATYLPIVPLHLSPAELQQKMVGSGPYKFVRSLTSGGEIQQVELTSNSAWPGGEPYITNFIFRYYPSEERALTAYRTGDVSAVLTATPQELAGSRHEITTQRVRAIFANTAREVLADENARRALLAGESGPSLPPLTLITHEQLAQNQELRRLSQAWQQQGREVAILPLNTMDLLGRLDAHDYDLVLAEIDLRADFDLYSLWHSTERAEGLNLSQLNDATIDGWLEEARTKMEPTERQALANQILERATQLGAYRRLEQVRAWWYVAPNVRGIELPGELVSPDDRLHGAAKWFVRTRASAEKK